MINTVFLKIKNFYTKNDMKKVKYSELETKNTVSQKGFINKFLSSVKQKMYGQTEILMSNYSK